MDKFKIIGKSRIAGEVVISGSKNAALPLLAAMLLPNDETVLHNVPTLKDTDTLIKLMSGMGVNVKKEGNTVIADARHITNYYAPMNWCVPCVHPFWCWGHCLGVLVKPKCRYLGGVLSVHALWIST